jgi:S1-C subfamily serine protease
MEPAMSAPTRLTEFSDALSTLVGTAAAAVVAVQSPASRSSGFVWRNGLIVTADDALGDGDVKVVFAGGREAPATVAGRDPSTDVVLLKADTTGAMPLAFRSTPVLPGALAAVVGKDGASPTAALGIVVAANGAWQSQRGGEIDARIELDLRMRRSAEGGLALDAAGAAIGMAVFGPRQRVIVIPGSTIDRVAARLDRDGRIARGYLGIGLQAVETGDGRIGIMVMSVDPDGPAARADIRQGDVIVGWEGKPVADVRSLVRLLGPDSVGRAVKLELARSGKPATITRTIAEKPAR